MSMNHPLALPSIAYLYFVKRQARILGRRAQRSGLHERARHYRLKEDWAQGLVRSIVEDLKAAVRVMRTPSKGPKYFIGDSLRTWIEDRGV